MTDKYRLWGKSQRPDNEVVIRWLYNVPSNACYLVFGHRHSSIVLSLASISLEIVIKLYVPP